MKIVKRACFDDEGALLIKPYRVKDLAAIYDVSPKTLRKWIAASAPTAAKGKGQYYSVGDVTKIINALGLPQKISIRQAA